LTRRALALACLLLSSFVLADEDPAANAGGRLAWVSGGELDLVGDLWVHAPFRVSPRESLHVDAGARTAVLRADSGLTFRLRDVDYVLDLGLVTRRGPFARLPLRVFAGQQGKVGVDAEGNAWLRYAGLGIESSGYRRTADPGRRFEWMLAAAPIVDERDVDGDFVLRGDGRLRLGPGSGHRGARFEVELHVDGIARSGGFDADVRAGPSWVAPVGGGKAARFFLHYQHGDHPLGLGVDALLAGFEYAGETGGSIEAPRIDAAVAAGAGAEDRHLARLRFRYASPPLLREHRLAMVLEANALEGRETNELYYRYHVGVERPLGESRAGVYFYHRSNHLWNGANDEITSLNVIEYALASGGWGRPGRPSSGLLRGAWGALDARAAVGVLLSSSFGEDRRWHVRAGARWTAPRPASGPRPWLMAEAEGGDVKRRVYSGGLSFTGRLDFAVEYHDDPQFFGPDSTALLLVARYGLGS